MTLKVMFEPKAWDEYLEWQGTDRKTLKRLNDLIKETRRTPFDGIGKPEALKGDLEGCWSRRIDKKHRLVYMVDDERIVVLQCRHHYSD